MTTDTVQLNHVRQGPSDAPAVFLGGSLGTTLAMWDGLADRLAGKYQVVRFDTRGHGASPAPAGPYTMTELASDVVALADELGLSSPEHGEQPEEAAQCAQADDAERGRQCEQDRGGAHGQAEQQRHRDGGRREQRAQLDCGSGSLAEVDGSLVHR